MTTRQAVIKAMAVLTTAFNRENSPTLTEAYQIALGKLSPGEVASAMERALSECKFMPTPAEFLALAGRTPRDIAAEATLAWDAVRKAMDGLDVYGNPDFGPVVNAVVRNLGGWVYLCEQKLSELEWRRKDFERVYRLWAEKDPSLLPDGAPLIGQWGHAPVTRIVIAGLPLQQAALAPVETPQAAEMKSLVRGLAEAKTQTGAAAPNDALNGANLVDQPVSQRTHEKDSSGAPKGGGSAESPPPRETKPPTRITEAEKAAALAKMREQLGARTKTPAAEVAP